MSEEKNLALEMLREFKEAFSASNDPEFWLKLIVEETQEVERALADTIKEFSDLSYVLAGYCTSIDSNDEIKEGHKAVLDYAAALIIHGREFFGDATLGEAFRRVHKSNMTKLGDDGKPIVREDGKILKGPNYEPPNILSLITGR